MKLQIVIRGLNPAWLAVVLICGVSSMPAGTAWAGDGYLESLINARVEYRAGEFSAAIDTLNSLLERDDLSGVQRLDARIWRSRCYASNRQIEEAKNEFVTIIRANPDWVPESGGWDQVERDALGSARRQLEDERTVALADSLAGVAPKEHVTCPTMTWPIVSATAVAAAGVASLYFHGEANSIYDDYKNSSDKSPDTFDDYKNKLDLGNAFGIAAGVLAVPTIYLWVKYFDDKSRCETPNNKQASFQWVPTPGGVVISLKF